MLLFAGCGSDDGGAPPAPVNAAPSFTSATASAVDSNFQGTIKVAATDPEGDALTFSLTGADAGAFMLSASGDLTFKTPPIFVSPTDVDFDNQYNVSVSVSDGKSTVSQPLAITVRRTVTGITATQIGSGFVDPVSIIQGSNVIVAQKDGTFYIVRSGSKEVISVPLPDFAPGSLFAATSSPALARFQDSLRTYYRTSAGALVETSYTFSSSGGFRTATPKTLLPTVSDPVNLTVYADYFLTAGLATSIGATQTGTDDRAQDLQSNIGKVFLTDSTKPIFASGVRNVAGISRYVDSGIVRLAITDRGLINDELNSVVQDASPIDLGWPLKDGNQTVRAGTPSGLLIDPLLTIPRNAATGQVLVGSAIVRSSIVLAFENGAIFTVPATALASSAALPMSVMVDRTTEFRPNTGSFGRIAFIRASATGLYVMTTGGDLYFVNVPVGDL